MTGKLLAAFGSRLLGWSCTEQVGCFMEQGRSENSCCPCSSNEHLMGVLRMCRDVQTTGHPQHEHYKENSTENMRWGWCTVGFTMAWPSWPEYPHHHCGAGRGAGSEHLALGSAPVLPWANKMGQESIQAKAGADA